MNAKVLSILVLWLLSEKSELEGKTPIEKFISLKNTLELLVSIFL
jgi:hypothetical protein